MIGHDAMNPLMIEDTLIGVLSLPDENGSDPPIAKARPSIYKSANRGQQRSAICFEVRSARCGLGFETLGKIGPRYDLGITIHHHCEPQFGKKFCGDIGLLTGLRGESRSLASYVRKCTQARAIAHPNSCQLHAACRGG